jgi:hypothetical protein
MAQFQKLWNCSSQKRGDQFDRIGKKLVWNLLQEQELAMADERT